MRRVFGGAILVVAVIALFMAPGEPEPPGTTEPPAKTPLGGS
jgi:hypothetical protein